MLKLVIGNKRLSSWSMRPWVLMKHLQIPFEEEILPFWHADWSSRVAAVTQTGGATGTVPVLIADGIAVGDSLAIAETLAELCPAAGVWPAERRQRARARVLSAEMHASFAAVREECAFDAFRDGTPKPLSARGRIQLARADAIFASAEADGFLCGAFCAADAFFAPLALRTVQYGLEVSPQARAYVQRIAALPAVREWLAGAEAERDWPPLGPNGRDDRRAVLTGEDAERLAQRWVAAWNARDLPAVLAMFAPDAGFVSPKAESLLGRAHVAGRAALEHYWSTALQKIPRLHFKLEQVDWDAARSEAVVIYLADLAGKQARAVERWHLNPAGLISYGEAYYGAAAA